MSGDVETKDPYPLRTKTPPANPTSTSGWNLLKSFKGFRFPEDSDGYVWTLPVVITDPSGSTQIGLANTLLGPLTDGEPNGLNVLLAGALNFLFNGTGWDRARGGNIAMHTVQASASGNTAVWTPAAGKHFRLFGFHVMAGTDVSFGAAAILGLTLLDSATNIWQVQNDIAAAQASAGARYFDSVIILPQNGYLSAAINNVLNISLSATLTTGKINVTAWGTEE